MSIAMGPVPSSVVATVTWHVVGLHGGKQNGVRLAGLGESYAGVRAEGEGLHGNTQTVHTHAHKGHD